MTVISKDDKLEWVAYLVIGCLGFWFLLSICLILLENDFSAFIKFPLALLASGVTLYAFKKYLGWYVEDGARLSAFGQIRKVGVGWLVSALYLFTILICLFATRHYSVAHLNFNLGHQLSWLSIFLLAAVIEEIIARGIVFRLITDKWNVVAGLVVSSITFGFVHLFNPNTTALSCLRIAITGGWLCGIAYAYHRTLWVPIGIHWAWNYMQSNIFEHSVPGSALNSPPILILASKGVKFPAGIEFDTEVSIISTAIGVAISAVYTILYFKKKARFKTGEDVAPVF
ncbi:CPBP family intramembrane glutamic endopeptidase [Prevotella sp. oral taxon 317]|jgi:hypothetical protein|uniref:CPBP family intramembrane glutamic endopeptidase n=1 Tax=Prevotella sp. oral taxon 317 TaxID=652721 RepID=UPI0001C40545|nr:type II CAAX endopeptidase family protein [Prevotella sp. oral taxon 317]EFC68544.1 CAAX amino terminal protease family protein [Prevotella sp. oral taxon 317 str. F0108]